MADTIKKIVRDLALDRNWPKLDEMIELSKKDPLKALPLLQLLASYLSTCPSLIEVLRQRVATWDSFGYLETVMQASITSALVNNNPLPIRFWMHHYGCSIDWQMYAHQIQYAIEKNHYDVVNELPPERRAEMDNPIDTAFLKDCYVIGEWCHTTTRLVIQAVQKQNIIDLMKIKEYDWSFCPYLSTLLEALYYCARYNFIEFIDTVIVKINNCYVFRSSLSTDGMKEIEGYALKVIDQTLLGAISSDDVSIVQRVCQKFMIDLCSEHNLRNRLYETAKHQYRFKVANWLNDLQPSTESVQGASFSFLRLAFIFKIQLFFKLDPYDHSFDRRWLNLPQHLASVISEMNSLGEKFSIYKKNVIDTIVEWVDDSPATIWSSYIHGHFQLKMLFDLVDDVDRRFEFAGKSIDIASQHGKIKILDLWLERIPADASETSWPMFNYSRDAFHVASSYCPEMLASMNWWIKNGDTMQVHYCTRYFRRYDRDTIHQVLRQKNDELTTLWRRFNPDMTNEVIRYFRPDDTPPFSWR